MTRVVRISDPYDIYIGRAGKGHDGYFGNTHTVEKYGRGVALQRYAEEFEHRLCIDSIFAQRIEALRGKTLACFCRPAGGFRGQVLCHGQIIAAYLDGYKPEDVP